MLKKLVNTKINEVFVEYQEANDIISGDIEPWDARYLDQLEKMLTNHIARICAKQPKREKTAASFYIYRDAEGIAHSVTYEQIDTDKFFYEISKQYAFDDCSGNDIIAIFLRGKEVQYAGWQPCMRFEYKDLNGNTVWVGDFPDWDH